MTPDDLAENCEWFLVRLSGGSEALRCVSRVDDLARHFEVSSREVVRSINWNLSREEADVPRDGACFLAARGLCVQARLCL